MIRFSCKATGSFEMLDQPGARLLAVIGKQASEQGIITTEQIPGAIAALRAATASDHKPSAGARENSDDGDEQPVSLAQRAFPLLDMLERAQAADQPVLWGV